MSENNEVLKLILDEIQKSKLENKEIYNNIKTHISKFETELLEQKDDRLLSEEKIKKLIYDLEKTLERELRRRDDKINDLEKDFILVKSDTELNTTNHKENRNNLNKAVFLVLSGFVGLIFYLFKSMGA